MDFVCLVLQIHNGTVFTALVITVMLLSGASDCLIHLITTETANVRVDIYFYWDCVYRHE